MSFADTNALTLISPDAAGPNADIHTNTIPTRLFEAAFGWGSLSPPLLTVGIVLACLGAILILNDGVTEL
jgi:hypothetical protein